MKTNNRIFVFIARRSNGFKIRNAMPVAHKTEPMHKRAVPGNKSHTQITTKHKAIQRQGGTQLSCNNTEIPLYLISKGLIERQIGENNGPVLGMRTEVR